MTRWVIVFPLLLVTLAGVFCGLAKRFADDFDSEERRAIRAFETRLQSREGRDRWMSKDGKYTVSVDRETGRVVRRDSAGNPEWSILLGKGLGHESGPTVLGDGRHIFVREGYDTVSALDPDTGRVVWRATVPNFCFQLGGDVLLLSYDRQVVGVAADSGTKLFEFSLLEDRDFTPSEIQDVAGLFLVQRYEYPGGDGAAFLIDRAGQVRHRFPCQVIAGLRVGNDRVFLTSGDVRRVTADDRTVWSLPFPYREWIAGGNLLQASDGDLVAFLYGQISNSGVQVVRFDAQTGLPRWRGDCHGLFNVIHSKYSHAADVELIGDRVRVISRGSSGTFVEWLDARSGTSLRRSERRR